VGINELGDMLDNGSRNLAEENEAPQALLRFEQYEKAHLSDTAFGGTSSQKPFRMGGCIDLG
jgi:hypothetical protein